MILTLFLRICRQLRGFKPFNSFLMNFIAFFVYTYSLVLSYSLNNYNVAIKRYVNVGNITVLDMRQIK